MDKFLNICKLYVDLCLNFNLKWIFELFKCYFCGGGLNVSCEKI